MSIEAWADAARHKYRQNAEHQRAIDTLQFLLEGKIDSDSGAGTIASIYEPLLKRDASRSGVGTFWAIICNLVRGFGGNKDVAERLVGLLNSISKLPDVRDEHGMAITPAWSSAGVYWRGLPVLTMIFREYAIEVEPGDEPDEAGDEDSQTMRLLNAITFGARYLALGRHPIGMPFHAEVSLMQGIEVPCQTLEQQQRAATGVPQAATWVILAGEMIYELCKIDYDRKDGAPGSTWIGDEWLWGKGRGYSLGRWALWKKRFSEIATIQEMKDGARDIAARAASEMERIEG